MSDQYQMMLLKLVLVVGSGSTTDTQQISRFKENSFPKILFIFIQKNLISLN